MFVTIERVKELTGYDVTLSGLHQAQGIIESYIGKVEAEVDGPNDLAILAKATAYQAAYMKDNSAIAFEQIATTMAVSGDSTTMFDSGFYAPWIAPLAIISCRRLSWMNSKSIHTGAIFGRPAVVAWERD